MPIPLYTEKNQAQNGASNPAQNNATGNNSQATTTSFAGNQFPTATNAQGQPLSKEEADRLYEERMEEEYAKREGDIDGASEADADIGESGASILNVLSDIPSPDGGIWPTTKDSR
ncbi:hypothetical protein BDV18DRAFT_155798 [Aspergillus unguis]